MYEWDPWSSSGLLTKKKRNQPPPIDNVLTLWKQTKNTGHLRIVGPRIYDMNEKKEVRPSWDFRIQLEDYRALFPESVPTFKITSEKEVEMTAGRGTWPALQVGSAPAPLWNPDTEEWMPRAFCGKIEYITAVAPFRGKDMVAWALQIQHALGIQMTCLYDASYTPCEGSPNGEMNLSLSRTTTKGQTFYESLGFRLAPDMPNASIHAPQEQLHAVWKGLTSQATFAALRRVWKKGVQLIRTVQTKMEQPKGKGKAKMPFLSVVYWDETTKPTNKLKDWMEFIQYWMEWGQALEHLHTTHPDAKSPFAIYQTREKPIPEGECGEYYNWLLILYQRPLQPKKRFFRDVPLRFQIGKETLTIPGAVEMLKWLFLQRTRAHTTWVRPVEPQPLQPTPSKKNKNQSKK